MVYMLEAMFKGRAGPLRFVVDADSPAHAMRALQEHVGLTEACSLVYAEIRPMDGVRLLTSQYTEG